MKKMKKMMALLIVAIMTMMYVVPVTVFAENVSKRFEYIYVNINAPVGFESNVTYSINDNTFRCSDVIGTGEAKREGNLSYWTFSFDGEPTAEKLASATTVNTVEGYSASVSVTEFDVSENLGKATILITFTANEPEATKGSITINNAANGETYTLYKVIGADINTSGGIDYDRTDVPEELSSYLTTKTRTDASGRTYTYVALMDGQTELASNATIPAAIVTAFSNWAENAVETAHEEASNGQAVFTNVDPGYYVITSSLGNVIMIDSATNPAAQVYEKNEGTPVDNLTKSVDSGNENVQIGDTVTYTISFNTANYSGSGADAKQIISYVLKDALPASLTHSSYTITVNGTPVQTTGDLFGVSGATVTWATPVENSNPVTYTSLYDNNSTIEVTYTATVNAAASGAITNTVTIDYLDKDNESIPDEPESTSKTIYTYAIDIQKTDGSGNALTGAQFKLYDASTNGNQIYVTGSDGAYVVSASSTETLIDAGSATVTGLDSDRTYYLEEVTAPDGYNKLTSRQEVTPRAVSQTTYTPVAAGAEYDQDETYYAENNGEYSVVAIANAEAFADYNGTLYTATTTTATTTTTSYEEATAYEAGVTYYAEINGEYSTVNIADAAAFDDYNGTLYTARTTTTSVTPGFDTITVINNAGAELPSTGGIGTTIFYIIGAILVIGGGIVLVTRRRMG